MVRAPNEEMTNFIASEKNPHFFKIYLPDHSSQKLKIPPGFINFFNGEVPNKAILRSCSGRVWDVEVEQVDDNLFFQNGWQEFVKDQSLKLGEFLVFTYNGDLVFNVKIFGTNACKREESLPCKDKQPEAEGIINKSTCFKKKFPEAEGIINNSTSFKQKLPEAEGIINNSTHLGQKLPRTQYGSPQSKMIEDMVLKAAGLAKPKNPHFLASFKPERPFEMFIPRRVITKYHLKIEPEMTIRDPSGKRWCVRQSKWKDGRVSFSSGWSDLCQGNNLEIDDKCIFEFIKGRDGKGGIIQMHIIRDLQCQTTKRIRKQV